MIQDGNYHANADAKRTARKSETNEKAQYLRLDMKAVDEAPDQYSK